MPRKNPLTKSECRIRAAFIDLLETKGFYQTRVSDILSKADVSRSTFYSYYEDKYQLLHNLQNELFEGLANIARRIRSEQFSSLADNQGECNPLFAEYFCYVRDNERLWNIFITGQGGSNFPDQMSRFLFQQMIDTQKAWSNGKDPEIPDVHSGVLCSWAYVALITYWLTTGKKETPEEMGKTLTVFWRRYLHWYNNP